MSFSRITTFEEFREELRGGGKERSVGMVGKMKTVSMNVVVRVLRGGGE